MHLSHFTDSCEEPINVSLIKYFPITHFLQLDFSCSPSFLGQSPSKRCGQMGKVRITLLDQ